MRTIILLTFFTALIGCSSSTTNPGNDDPEAAKEIHALIPEAAGGPFKEFEVMALGSGPPSFDEWPNQSISVFMLGWQPPKDKPDAATQAARQAELNYIGDAAPNPTALANAMSRSKNKGYASIIQPEFITDITCKVDGDTATGTVSFKAENLYQGKIDYTARKGDKGWRIEEFRLPAHKIRVTRQADGLWKQAVIREKK